jgi:HD superfamily phosphodiesterase
MRVINQIEEYAKKISSDLDELHSFGHFKFVADNARLIAKAENCDEKTAYIVGLMHDLGRVKYKGKWVKETKSSHHGMLSADMARQFLNKIQFNKRKIKEICDAISTHVKPKTQKTKLAKIIWDADKLSFFRKKNSEDYIKLLVKKGMSVKKAKGEIRYSWSFYYNLFYTKTAKKIAHDYLKSIREKVFRVKGSDWKPPSVIRKNERKFSDI